MDAASIVALVRRIPGWERAEPTVTPIETGITNRNFRVDLDGRSYVVRIPGERTELLGIDRAGEAEATLVIAEGDDHRVDRPVVDVGLQLLGMDVDVARHLVTPGWCRRR